jgi:hypothetical protein
MQHPKHCKVCNDVVETATYVAAIEGWRCNECHAVETQTFAEPNEFKEIFLKHIQQELSL